MINQEVAKIFQETADLLDIKGVPFKPQAYRKAAIYLETSCGDVGVIYKEGGLKALKALPAIGESMAKKIEEYIKKNKIKYYDELKKETAIQQIVTFYFNTKGISLDQLKNNARKKKIVYSRFTRPAKQLIELAGSPEKAKEALQKVAEWAKSRDLDYAIETVFKKWLELDRLKPKEKVKKPFYKDMPMVWSQARKRYYVITPDGEWLEFADREQEIEWRIIK